MCGLELGYLSGILVYNVWFIHRLNDSIAHMFYSIAIAIIAGMVYAGWTGGDPFLISICTCICT